MAITKQDVRHVAELARLEFTPEEEDRLTEQLDKILRYMEKLNGLDTEAVEPLAHVGDIVNAFREDRVTNQAAMEPLLANAPDREGNLIKVPKIIE